ncbi:MAG: sugar ABC transporter ATP-binding protein, partial [Deltaproteobacteria bacterium]|nr:sugar ABC transporter ATP-binding protein [Deltaproteobacteria bacterium]
MLLKAEGVRKSFGGVHALKGVSFELEAGEIHALVGANGAGKSTLAKVIIGFIRPDSAVIELMGQPVEFHSPREAIDSGIAMVTQQLSLAPDLTVAENILLTELGRPGRLRPGKFKAKAAEILSNIADKGTIHLDEKAGNLSTSHRQIVEIAKALAVDAKIIIFDEPTTSLTPYEVERLFDIMTSLVKSGKGLIFVSHRLEEIFAISDRVTVLRDGRNVDTPTKIAEMTQAALVRRMIGFELGADVYHQNERRTQPARSNHEKDSPPILELRKVKVPPNVHDASFGLWPGEILGLAGLVGAGRSETARALFGLERVISGEFYWEGKPFTPRNPAEAMKKGLVLLPEDRHRQGLIPHFSVQENALLSCMTLHKGIWASSGRFLDKLKQLLKALKLSENLLETNVLNLSGGMQQKVVISRGLLLEPKVLVVDEPTQGVDIGTRSEIYAILRSLAADGMAVIFISSDFKEILGISDRVVVMTEGRIAADV